MSDLHIELGDLAMPKTAADVAVLAGDIHVGLPAARWSGALADRLGMAVVQIVGNHEHYNTLSRSAHHFQRTIADLRAATAIGPGRVVLLERETAIFAGVRFVGCTLWTDYELYGDPSAAMAHAEFGMTDFHTIAYQPGVRFTTNEVRREFLPEQRFLAEEVAKPFHGPTVVITHHLSSLQSVAPQFKGEVGLAIPIVPDCDAPERKIHRYSGTTA
jgi:hypothetical protein